MYRPSILPQAFTAIGHFLVHLITSFYPLIILRLEAEWTLDYDTLVDLNALGVLMLGAAALPAGWLADRIGSRTLLSVYFLGLGAASILAGLSSSSVMLEVALILVGCFAAIFHPVGLAWLVRNAGHQPGRALGLNGIFGIMGLAAAGISASILLRIGGWRLVFIAPGILCLLIGIAFVYCAWRRLIGEGEAAAKSDHPPYARPDALRGFAILMAIVFLMGLLFQATQTSLPKLFALRVDGYSTEDIGYLISAVYFITGILQYAGGILADRFAPRWVFIWALLLHLPLLALILATSGLLLLVPVTALLLAGSVMAPAETVLASRLTPAKHRNLAFGLKYVAGFGSGYVAIKLISQFTASSLTVADGVANLYWALFGLLALASVLALGLPRDRERGKSRKENPPAPPETASVPVLVPTPARQG